MGKAFFHVSMCALAALWLVAVPAHPSGASEDPVALRQLAEELARSGDFEAAKTALRTAIDQAPHDESLYQALADLLEREKSGEAWEAAEAPVPRAAARKGGTTGPPTPGAFAIESASGLGILGALALAATLVLSLVVRELRGKGDIAVAIEYPAEQRGSFSVRLARARAKPSQRRTDGDDGAARASSRFEHTMVARETQFRAVPTRRYYVVLEGALDGLGEGSHRKTVFEERAVRVERGRCVRAEFDLRPSECLVDVRIAWEEGPADRARVAVGGDPTSLRYARSGHTTLCLGHGEHTILVGCGDRAAERTVRVESFDPQTLEIDLDDALSCVFVDCEAAVEPFLQGDLSVASTALERAGKRDVARLLSARFHHSRGNREAAALQYEAAGRLLEAAEIYADCGAFERAAGLYERGGDPARAGEMHNAAGDLVRAGLAYEEAGELESAAICYRDADALPKLMDVLEKLGQHFEAGKIAVERNDTTRAIRNFQQVEARDPSYRDACRILAETFASQGKNDLAVQKADETLTFSQPDQTSPDSFLWYGDILERTGRTARAFEVLQDLAARFPDNADLKGRVELLRKKLSSERKAGTPTEGFGGPAMADGVTEPNQPSRYEILGEVGRGGMGVVYKARDKRLERVVALKRLPDNLKENPRAVELFMREARSAAALNHQSIVTVHDVDQENGNFFLTMELLEGSPLNRILKRRGRLTPLDTARLGVQIAAGLQYAHERRIIHRDIKTANLFFTQARTLKIMDFGLAKMLEEVRKANTMTGGTPFYMSPEQVVGRGVDHRSDIYALGVTLFELVTGGVPFKEGDVMYHHRHTPAPDPRTRTEDIPGSLATLILKLMAKDPDERPQTAEEVGQALQQIVAELRGSEQA